MIDETDKSPEGPDRSDKSGKRRPWWLRSSIWFALGTITTSVVGFVAFILLWVGLDESIYLFVIYTLILAGLAALPAVVFAVWAGFRAKNAKNWKAYGFFLPLVCGIVYPIFVVAICRRVFYTMGDTTSMVVVSIVVCIPLLLVLAEFCVRLQPSERPWYQYTLRSLVIFMAVAGVLFACLGELVIYSYKHQELEVRWSELGATSISYSQGNLEHLSFIDVSDAALKELENVTTLENLRLVYTNTNFSDSNLESLAPMEHLILMISGTQVTDLSPLKDLTNLERLDLEDTQVSDLSPLEGLTNLKALVLDQTQVTDLSSLKGLTNLKWVILEGTPVSKEEIQKLQKALPKCGISMGGKIFLPRQLSIRYQLFEKKATEQKPTGRRLRNSGSPPDPPTLPVR